MAIDPQTAYILAEIGKAASVQLVKELFGNRMSTERVAAMLKQINERLGHIVRQNNVIIAQIEELYRFIPRALVEGYRQQAILDVDTYHSQYSAIAEASNDTVQRDAERLLAPVSHLAHRLAAYNVHTYPAAQCAITMLMCLFALRRTFDPLEVKGHANQLAIRYGVWLSATEPGGIPALYAANAQEMTSKERAIASARIRWEVDSEEEFETDNSRQQRRRVVRKRYANIKLNQESRYEISVTGWKVASTGSWEDIPEPHRGGGNKSGDGELALISTPTGLRFLVDLTLYEEATADDAWSESTGGDKGVDGIDVSRRALAAARAECARMNAILDEIARLKQDKESIAGLERSVVLMIASLQELARAN